MYRPASLTLIAALLVQGLAFGADGDKSSIARTKRLWNPDIIMQQACDGISRHYNLDDAQKERACGMLTDGVTKFLDKHNKDVWPILAELAPFQLTGQQPDAATAKRIANRGYHLFEEARAEIMKAQDEFRTLLRPDQVRIHDRDLKALKRQLDGVQKRFDDWKQGKVDAGGPLDNLYVGGKKVVPGDMEAQNSRVRPIHNRRRKVEDDWDRYVRQFIENYKLDDSQSTTALKILKDMKDKAKNYRTNNESEIREAEQMLAQAKAARPIDLDAVDLARTIERELKKPFEDYFEDLKSRLKQIPTQKQREDYYARNPNLKPEKKKPAKTKVEKAPAKPAEKPATPKKQEQPPK